MGVYCLEDSAYEKASENDCQALGATRTSLGTPVIRRSRSESRCIGRKKKLANHIVSLPVRAAPHVPPLAYVKPCENDFATLGTTRTRYGTRESHWSESEFSSLGEHSRSCDYRGGVGCRCMRHTTRLSIYFTPIELESDLDL